MLPRTYDNQVCSVARALEAIGDRWTMLVIRDAFVGVRRFDEFQQRLGIARNVLTDRLSRLVEDGILERHRYQERPPRFEYRLTDKGVDLFPVLVSLMKWGDRHAPTRTARPWPWSTVIAAERWTSGCSARAAASRLRRSMLRRAN